MSTAARRFIVTGEPDSGKTAFVTKHRRPDDVVWDHDAIARELIGVARHEPIARHMPLLNDLRRRVLEYLARHDGASCFVIMCDENDAEIFAGVIHARVLTMPRDRDYEI